MGFEGYSKKANCFAFLETQALGEEVRHVPRARRTTEEKESHSLRSEQREQGREKAKSFAFVGMRRDARSDVRLTPVSMRRFADFLILLLRRRNLGERKSATFENY